MLCGRPWSVCEVVLVPYVVVVTVMHVVLFVLHAIMMTECNSTRVTALLVWRTGEV